MNSFRENIKSSSTVYISTFAALILLNIIIFLFPVELSAYRKTDITAPFWSFVTGTGSFWGGLTILVLMTTFLIHKFIKHHLNFDHLILFLTLVFFTYIFSIGVTEYSLKDLFKKPRPSQNYFFEKGYLGINESVFFSMPLDQRKKYFEEKINPSDSQLTDIYSPILKQWIYESGFSFPSGHALTSFFFGTILSFLIFRTEVFKNKYLCFLPLVWSVIVSISRIVTGLHYPSDVTAGSIIGAAAGLVLISLPNSNELFK
jgi:membrane-associated phospholipid phosphatase